MAAPDPFLGTAEAFTRGDWKEAVAGLRPSSDNMFSATSGDASLTGIKIVEEKTRGCLRYCLGYNAVSGSSESPKHLYRTLPVAHPRYPNLYCTGASERGVVADPSGTTSGGTHTLKYPGNKPLIPLSGQPASAIPVLGAPPFAGIDGNFFTDYGGRTKYKYSVINLRFEPLPYTMLLDAAMINTYDEYKRNTFIDQEPHAEILSLSGFKMLYTEGVGLITPATSPYGQQYQAELGLVTIKSDVRMTWVGVPESWIMYPDTKKPTRILFRLGTLNEGSFLGYEDGTLNLLGVKFTRKCWPLYQPNPTESGPQESPFVYDIEFLFGYFNPEKGYTGNPPLQITTNLGWNNFPYRGGKDATDDPQAGLWFYASYTGDPDERSLYQYTDFTRLFDAAANGLATGE